jgi:hypothetical protein
MGSIESESGKTAKEWESEILRARVREKARMYSGIGIAKGN